MVLGYIKHDVGFNVVIDLSTEIYIVTTNKP